MNTCMWAGSVGLTVWPSEELSVGTSRQPSNVSCSALIWSAMMLLIRRFRGRGRRQRIRGDVFALELRPVHLKSSSIRLGASPSLGAPWAFAAPTGPPLVLREPQFHKLRPGRPTSPVDGPAFYLPGAGAPDFVAILVPGLRPQLRQHDCPNSDHAKFFSTTQAPESRRSHATSVLRRGRPPRPGFEASAPRSGPRTAGFSDEVAAGTKSKNALGAGALQERVGDEAVHRVGHL